MELFHLADYAAAQKWWAHFPDPDAAAREVQSHINCDGAGVVAMAPFYLPPGRMLWRCCSRDQRIQQALQNAGATAAIQSAVGEDPRNVNVAEFFLTSKALLRYLASVENPRPIKLVERVGAHPPISTTSQ